MLDDSLDSESISIEEMIDKSSNESQDSNRLCREDITESDDSDELELLNVRLVGGVSFFASSKSYAISNNNMVTVPGNSLSLIC